MIINNSISKTFIFSVLLIFSSQAISKEVKTEKTKVDTRINLGFTPSEKAVFLAGMRQMLNSIQGIMAGIGSNDPKQIIKAARYSGNRMARATSKSIKKKTPLAFKQIGGADPYDV